MKILYPCLALAVVASSAVLAQTAGKSDFIALQKDAKVLPVAIWWDNGKQFKARGEDAKSAPAGASQVKATLYDLGGFAMRVVRLPKGTQVESVGGPTNTLVYVESGHVHVSSAGAEGDLHAGDAVREVAGRPTKFTVLEPAVFIEADVPAQTK
ncbi:MAG TPA: hypothetical protein VIY90_09240 [Steroidobacteraceae bacterium]